MRLSVMSGCTIVLAACGNPSAWEPQSTASIEQELAVKVPAVKGDGGTEGGATNVAYGAMVWKDATGAVVPFLLETTGGGGPIIDEQGGLFFDSAGTVWAFGEFSCGVTNPICPPYGNGGSSVYTQYTIYWENPDCAGTEYVPYVHANFAFNLLDGTTRAIMPTAKVSSKFAQSSGTPSSCTNAITKQLVVNVKDAPVVTPPTSLPFTLPLHPEMLR